jgi:hypothetical protein
VKNLLRPAEAISTISVGKTEFDSIKREGEEVSGQPGPFARGNVNGAADAFNARRTHLLVGADACGRAGWAGMVMRLARQERPTVSFPFSLFFFCFLFSFPFNFEFKSVPNLSSSLMLKWNPNIMWDSFINLFSYLIYYHYFILGNAFNMEYLPHLFP